MRANLAELQHAEEQEDLEGARELVPDADGAWNEDAHVLVQRVNAAKVLHASLLEDQLCQGVLELPREGRGVVVVGRGRGR